MKVSLTKKQKIVVSALKQYINTKGYPPTLRELSSNLKISVPAVHQHLRVLSLKGVLVKKYNKQRSIELQSQNSNSYDIKLPLIGSISAGYGIDIFEDLDRELVSIPSAMINSKSATYYCLKVDGYSMQDDGIQDKDIVVIKSQSSAQNGDIVVGIIKDNFNEQATLKKFYEKGNKVELRPRNPNFKSIFVDKSRFEIRGVFCGLIRNVE